MESKILTLLAPVLSSIVTFIVTNWHHRREKQSDLETKLTARIEDLTLKIIGLNEKYINAMEKINALMIENEELKNQIEKIKKQ